MFTLRQATEEDYDFLYGLHRLVMRTYVEPLWGWHEEWQAEYFRKKFNVRQRQIILVDDTAAGVLVVEDLPDYLYLALIELRPEYQGRGIGTTIIKRLIAQAETAGKPVHLHVLRSNDPARRLYERLGFIVIAEEQYRYCMSNELQKPESASSSNCGTVN